MQWGVDMSYYLDQSFLSPISGRIKPVVYSAPVDLDVIVESIDSFSYSDVLSGEWLSQQSFENFTPSDSLGIPVYITTITDTFSASDTLSEPDYAGTFTDMFSASDSLGGVLTITGTLSDQFAPSDRLASGIIVESVDAFSLSDSLASAITATALVDAFSPSDSLSGEQQFSGSLIDTFSASDTLGGLWLGSSTDSFSASDSLSGNAHSTELSTDAFSLSDTLGGAVALYGTLSDDFTPSDTLTGKLTLYGVLTDSFAAGDNLLQAQSQAILAINAETGAVSEYTFVPTVQGLGEWRGTLYLATDTGLYALDNTTDDGTAIEWEFRTGFANLGTDKLKRIQDVNVLAKGAGNVQLLLVADRHGTKQERRYQLVKLTANDFRDQVIHAAKGIQSVYWQTGCRGIGPAEIDEIKVQVEPLSRRR